MSLILSVSINCRKFMPVKMIQDFLKLEAASGIILMITAIAAMIIAN